MSLREGDTCRLQAMALAVAAVTASGWCWHRLATPAAANANLGVLGTGSHATPIGPSPSELRHIYRLPSTPGEVRDPFHGVVLGHIEPATEPPSIEPVRMEAARVLKVSSVMLTPRRMVVIGERVYGEGDIVEGFRLVRIGREGVTVERNGIQVVVEVP